MRLALLLRVAALIALASAARADDAPPAPRPNIARVVHQPLGGAPTLGPADALVTVELFFIPGAAQSQAALQHLVALAEHHPRRLRLVLRPLERQGQILVPEAILEAGAHGKAWALLDLITDAGKPPSRDQLLEQVAAVGVDPARVIAAWDDERHKAALDANERRRVRRYAPSVPDALFNGRSVRRPVPSLSDEDLEQAYQDAYDRARQLLADGVPRAALAAAFERDLDRPPTMFVPGAVEDDDDDLPDTDPTLMARAVDTRGLPSLGPAAAPVTVLVFCDLTQRGCHRQLATAARVIDLFPSEARVVWMPWYSIALDVSSDADQLARAAMCATAVDAGWEWVTAAIGRGQRAPLDARVIPDLVADAGLDPAALTACLAQLPVGAARVRIAQATQGGITHGPTVVVGGRIYVGGVAEPRVLQSLIEDELEPGLLDRLAPDWRTPPP
jgi:2-hydroxychromene-2-carboxylate isomerase